MLPKLQRSLDSLEERKRVLVAELRLLPREKVCYRPAANSWSMLDVADHLMKVEGALVESANRTLAGGGRNVRLGEAVGAIAVISVMRSPLRVRTPPSASEVLPQPDSTLDRIETQWNAVRIQLAALASKISADQEALGIFQHPVAGFMSPSQSFAFLDAHFRHHGYQLRRLSKAVAGAAAQC